MPALKVIPGLPSSGVRGPFLERSVRGGALPEGQSQVEVKGAPGEEDCGGRVHQSQEQKHLCISRLSRDVLHIWNYKWQVQLWPLRPIFLLVLRLSCTGHWHPSIESPRGRKKQERESSKLDIVMHTWSPSPLGTEAGGPRI